MGWVFKPARYQNQYCSDSGKLEPFEFEPESMPIYYRLWAEQPSYSLARHIGRLIGARSLALPPRAPTTKPLNQPFIHL